MHTNENLTFSDTHLSWHYLVLLLSLTLVTLPPVYAHESLLISSYEYPPYTSTQLASGGMRTELITAAFDAVMITAKVNLYPTKRAQSHFLNSPSLMYLGITSHFSKQEQKTLAFIPLMPIRLTLFYYSPIYPQAITFKTETDLKPFIIGTMLGSASVKKLNAANVTVQEQSNLEGILKTLHAGRIDFAALTDLHGIETSKKLFPDEYRNFKQLDKALMETWVGLVFHKNDKASQISADKFEQGMRKIMADGTYLNIVSRYYDKGKVPDNILNFIKSYSRHEANKTP